MPYIARPNNTILYEFCIHVEVIFLRFIIVCGKQISNLGLIEARE